MNNNNDLFQKIQHMKNTRPADYKVFVKNNGKCSVCGSTEDVDVHFGKSSLTTFCRGCVRIQKECHRLGMDANLYKKEKEELIKEIFERLGGVFRRSHKLTTQQRNMQIYDLHLRGRDHAHIADLYELSRERVRQIIYHIKRANLKDGRKKQ